MPVRIYEIAKKVGIPSKEVLAKAKELGITNAKVASSTLDKITAEYLEEQITGKPEPETLDKTEVKQPASEPVIITAPPSEPTLQEEPALEQKPALEQEPATESTENTNESIDKIQPEIEEIGEKEDSDQQEEELEEKEQSDQIGRASCRERV